MRGGSRTTTTTAAADDGGGGDARLVSVSVMLMLTLAVLCCCRRVTTLTRILLRACVRVCLLYPCVPCVRCGPARACAYTQERIPKASAHWYKAFIAQNANW